MKQRFLTYITQNHWLLYVVSWCYNILHFSHVFDLSKNNIVYKGSFLKKTQFKIKGVNNTILIHPENRLRNCLVSIRGNSCHIEIGKHCNIANTQLWIEDDNGKILIDGYTTCEGAHIAATEGKPISIGEDCMISSNVQIRNGDSHSIVRLGDDNRINFAKEIVIENHVWLGEGVKVLKGSHIKSNSIIGTASVVSGSVDSNSIYAGLPAKKTKENISWHRDR